MSRTIWILTSLLWALPCHAAVGVRILFGLSDTDSKRWDGSVSLEGALLASMEPWRFEDGDALTGNAGWQASTHRIRHFLKRRNAPIVANGVILWLKNESEETRIHVTTAQGDFSTRLGEIPYGRTRKLLDGRVMADRVPESLRLTDSPDEQDYPAAAAGRNGDMWLAYVEFKHHPEHNRLRASFRDAPPDFTGMQASTGGDQLLVRHFAEGTWGVPISVGRPGGDIFRTALAVDGSGRPWVFWSENREGNFDICASRLQNNRPGEIIQISRAAGADIAPVAVTDASGHVWVAWQGWRTGKAAIFSARQDGSRFSAPSQVSRSGANDWNPTIAADLKGHIAVVWDSYRNGNYDLYSRVATDGRWGEERPVAMSALYEAYPSAAYDREGRLWVAYEEGAERWGKDFGSHDTSGVALSQGRAIRLLAIDPEGRRSVTASDFSPLLPGVPRTRVDEPGQQDQAAPLPALFHFEHLTRTEADLPDWTKPHPEQARNRLPNVEAQDIRGPRNSAPRLTIDGSNRLWLAFRSEHPIRWAPIGTAASGYVVSFDGNTWTGPVFLAHSDNLVDNRPALVSIRPGDLTVIGSSDGRRVFVPYDEENRQFGSAMSNSSQFIPDPYNNDIYAQSLSLGAGSGKLAVKPAATQFEPVAESSDLREKTAVERLRAYRIKTPGGSLRILRGEFHRHSELSEDGGPDGTLLDQYRYALDAAALDWLGCCDHDNGEGREYPWWTAQKLTDVFHNPGAFATLFSYERSVHYPDGHRNVLLARRGIRPLPRLLPGKDGNPDGQSDTRMLYRYLHQFEGIAAVHTSATSMGTDWRDNDPGVEPVVEVYQGIRQSYEMPGAPRANSAADSIGVFRGDGFINRALALGYKLGFEASSDHISTHMSYSCVYARDATREALMEALRQRHVYAATDNILADVRCEEFMMGDTFVTSAPPTLQIKLLGTAQFAQFDIIKDGRSVYSSTPHTADVALSWTDNAPRPNRVSYYYVRGEQENGELVWTSPMWIEWQRNQHAGKQNGGKRLR